MNTPEHGSRPSFFKGRALRFLLFRYLISSFLAKRSRSQATIGVVLPVLGVAIGVAAFTVVLSVMTGFVTNMKGRLLGLESHIEIVRAEGFGNIDASGELLEKLERLDGNVVAAAPFQKGDAILQTRSRAATVLFIGIDPARGKQSSGFEKFLTVERDLLILSKDAQSLEDGASFPAVILGRELASMLNVTLGDRVTLVSTTPEDGPGGLAPRQMPVVVVDILATGSPTHDAKLVLASEATAAAFLDIEGEWAGVQLRLKEPLDAESVAKTLDVALAAEGLRAKPWTEANRTLLRALKLERWGMSFVLYMVIVVGCFSITITLVLAVKRKAREMAILRAVGFEKKDLGLLYLLEGFVIGAIGAGIGLAVGLGLLEVIRSAKFSFVNQVYAGKNIPVIVDWESIVLVSVGSLVLAMIAAVWPAWEVMKIDVVETLSDRA
ncbi:MAG: ABC transporter permease [Silvanigrellales bacterium]|jgi:lipoprotein-releasing system permease protein|nr:ABC transporter permease [Silvanigrellales bacterium]